MSTASDWNEQRARDRAAVGENYYSGEQALEQHLAASRRQIEAEAEQAKAAWDASAEGEMQAAADEIAVAGAMLSPQKWEALQVELGQPGTPQPVVDQLPLRLRQRVHDERLANLLRDKRTDR